MAFEWHILAEMRHSCIEMRKRNGRLAGPHKVNILIYSRHIIRQIVGTQRSSI